MSSLPPAPYIGDIGIESLLTTIFPCGQTTDVPAHGHKAIKILLQALIRLLVQTGYDAELRPVKCFLFLIINNTKGGHRSVEVCLLSPSPPWDLIRKGERAVLPSLKKKKSQQLLTEHLLGEPIELRKQGGLVCLLNYFYLSSIRLRGL